MPLVTVTRLRLRSGRYLLPFLWDTLRIGRQARHAAGSLAGTVRRADGAFWTLTLWQDTAAMRAFMMAGAHRKAMPKLAGWCDEASLADWEQPSTTLPDWEEAERILGERGRVSPVAHPSPAQAAGKPLGGGQEKARRSGGLLSLGLGA